MSSLPTLLLTTKLYRPPADANWLARPELLTRLPAGLTRKLILISAPAGFGKSTLVSQWLAECTLPSTWLSLDEGDGELVQFLSYLCAAVDRSVPGACANLQKLLAAPNPPEAEYLADLLVVELNALPVEIILVLDDYQHIRSAEVHHLMRHLLRYLPPHLHLVILSRTDPPLHLGRLRVAQQICEIRAADLRFTLAEAQRFLQARSHQPVSDDLVSAIQTRTEGWVTGLQLAVLSMQNQKQPANELAAGLGGGHRLIMGYLVEEVMTGLPAAVTAFLTRSALLDRFCAPLGDALLVGAPWPNSSRSAIAWAEAHNLFIVPLDDEGLWYRYHDLFRDFLRQRLKHELDADGIAELHRRASVWLAEADLIDDALQHALAAGQDRFAADLVEAHFHSMLDGHSPMYRLARWLGLFGEETMQNHAGLLVAQTALAAFGMRAPVRPDLFTHIETLLSQDATLDPKRRLSLEADLDLMHGFYAYAHDDPQVAIRYFAQAAAKLPRAHAFARAQAIINLVNMYNCTGDAAQGRALLDTALAEEMAQQRPTMIVLLGALTTLQVYAAELPQAALTAARVMAEAAAHAALPAWQVAGYVDIWLGRTLHLRGIIAYEQNDLAAAAGHWRQLEALRYRTHPAPFHDSLVGKALIAQIRGAPTEALAYSQAAHEFAVEMRSADLQAKSAALDARLVLLAGDSATAVARTHGFGVTANQGSAFGLTLPALTRIHALLADAAPAGLATALDLCTACLARAGKMNNTHLTIQVTALQAVVLHKLERGAEARQALAQTLTLAEPGEFLRTFLDLGAPMVALLHSYRAPRAQVNYVKRLLAACDVAHTESQRHSPRTQLIRLQGVTPLTPRELELLTLSGQGLTIDEIAAKLVISPNTVKKHTYNIYTKLGVHNGRQALTKAQGLGLL